MIDYPEDILCWCEGEDVVLTHPCFDCGRPADVRPLDLREVVE